MYSAAPSANSGMRVTVCSVGFKQACAEGGAVGCSAREIHQALYRGLLSLGGQKNRQVLYTVWAEWMLVN